MTALSMSAPPPPRTPPPNPKPHLLFSPRRRPGGWRRAEARGSTGPVNSGWSVFVSEAASASRWLDGLKAGDQADVHRLWDRFFRRLVRLAGTRLPGHARREYDEEDVALSA